MKDRACLDAGVITLFYAEDVPDQITMLKNQIKNKTIDAYTLNPLLTEAVFHICKIKGKDAATQNITNFLNTYPVSIVPIDTNIVIKAGLLRCQYRGILSYNDCFAVAFCLNKRITLHTTEKGFKKILPKLSLQTYNF